MTQKQTKLKQIYAVLTHIRTYSTIWSAFWEYPAFRAAFDELSSMQIRTVTEVFCRNTALSKAPSTVRSISCITETPSSMSLVLGLRDNTTLQFHVTLHTSEPPVVIIRTDAVQCILRNTHYSTKAIVHITTQRVSICSEYFLTNSRKWKQPC